MGESKIDGKVKFDKDNVKSDNFKNILNGLKSYIVDSTATLVVSTPLFATMETFVSEMSTESSLESRIKVAELFYMGLGFAYTKLRDVSKYALKITDLSSKKTHFVYDSIYSVLFGIGLSIPLYLSSGASIEQTIKATSGGIILSLSTGAMTGYVIDSFRDLTGVKQSLRLPEKIRLLNSKVKKSLATGMIVASISLTAIIYGVNDYFNHAENSEARNIKDAVWTLPEKTIANRKNYVANF